jgi:predicted RNA-binding Zn ribbon-like protein
MPIVDRFKAASASSRAGSLDFVGCELALDFTNTSSGRNSPTHQEHLHGFKDLLAWVEHAKVVSPEDCSRIRGSISEGSNVATTTFASALDTREVIWRIATALAEGRVVNDDLRQRLVALHALSLGHAGMELRNSAYIWAWDARRDVRSAILGPIALSALTLLMERDLSRTKRCEGADCGWLFLDTTKNKTRRWCEMRVCGNRSKVRAARLRKKLADR